MYQIENTLCEVINHTKYFKLCVQNKASAYNSLLAFSTPNQTTDGF